ncbi:PEP-CTERM sorting domain-containing protein [bacterium]|nr:PEP-CTERM sorting domain-containing protein [bacterium]
MNHIKIPTIAATLFAATFSNGAVLVDWDFSALDWRAGQGSGLVLNDPAPNPILSSPAGNAASGITTTDLTPSAGLNVVINATTAAGEADIRDFDFGGNGSNENYMEFTINADTSGSLNIESISISQWRNGAGAVDGMAFDVSVDGGAFTLYDAIQVDPNRGGGPSFDTFTFTEAINGADSVAIRFAPRNVNEGSTGNIHVNGLQVTGTVIPEPTASLLTAIAGMMFLIRRRK